jgi:hypothetical protein
MLSLGGISGSQGDSQAIGISADGSTIVGIGSVTLGTEAFRWRAETGMVGLGSFWTGPPTSRATSASANGRVVVGKTHSLPPARDEAFRWTPETGMVGLGGYPLVEGTLYRSQADWVSPDGNIIYGETGITTLLEYMFRWIPESGMVPLPEPLETIQDASNDGAYVVGRYGGRLAIWDDANGPRRIDLLLMDEYGIRLDGWILIEASGISGDGRWICGRAGSPNADDLEAWLAFIPLPGDTRGDFSGDSQVDGDDAKPFGRCMAGPGQPVFYACASAVDIDATGPSAGAVDLRDFAAYQRLITGTCIDPAPLDLNQDCRVSLDDMTAFTACLRGPGVLAPCANADLDDDGDTDLADFAAAQRLMPL